MERYVIRTSVATVSKLDGAKQKSNNVQEGQDTNMPVRKPTIVTDDDDDKDYNDGPDNNIEKGGNNTSSDEDDIIPCKRLTSARRKKASADVRNELSVKSKKSPCKRVATLSKSVANETDIKRVKVTPTVNDHPTTDDILATIPLVTPPSPPSAADRTKKVDFRANAGHAARPPTAPGSKNIPTGAPNCLAGLSFVLTGVLESLDRADAQSLIKKYGGRVATSPSAKTSFVVLGADAGPKKLEVIRKFKIRTINEDGLLALISKMPANGGNSAEATKYMEKLAIEEKKIRQMAAEMDKTAINDASTKGEAVENAAGRTTSTTSNLSAVSADPPSDQLWTVKYAPTQLSHVCGNKIQVERLTNWLRLFPKYVKAKFKMGGPDGMGVYRAVMIHGPPGIGKTTVAHLCAKLEGYDIVETNASDFRGKAVIEESLGGALSSTSVMGFLKRSNGKEGSGTSCKNEPKRLALIMDEVDGMSAGDRGGVGALAAMCKVSKVPIILICNDRKLPKMKPFDGCTYDMPFRRPTTDQIRSRILTIAYREGLQLSPSVVNVLIEGSGADIRQVINMLASIKIDSIVQGDAYQGLDHDKGREMSREWQKYVVLRPWDITAQILNGANYSVSSKSTLKDKADLYFHDYEFSYLMLQENYLQTNPARAASYKGKERGLKLLELVDEAAASISDGDLVDSLIHGTEQNWSLMPVHAITAFVRPASFVAGNLTGRINFTQWLGKNSAQNKMERMLKELQCHLRMRTQADRSEVRLNYLPILWYKTVRRIEKEGRDCLDDVIQFMDQYYLSREDIDTITGLGLEEMNEKNVHLDSKVKAAFTRMYNERPHPLGMSLSAASVMRANGGQSKQKPDLEDAFDDSSDDETYGEAKSAGEKGDKREESGSEDYDITKDKLIKAVNRTRSGNVKGKDNVATAKRKRSRKANEKDGDDDKDNDDTNEGTREKPRRGASGRRSAKSRKV